MEAIFAKRAIVNPGDSRRWLQAMKKAQAGEKVTIGVIGGSITEGASSSSPAHSYAGVIAAWWREKFPAADIRLVNAGIGATGTYIAVHRLREHLLAHRPDVAVVEFAANDSTSPHLRNQYEGLIRTLLLSDQCPGVLLLFMSDKTGINVQETHSEVGFHYRLPMLSFRDAIWPAISNGSLLWENLYTDQVHPNDAGHLLVGRIVISWLEQVYAELQRQADTDLPQQDDIPAPLTAEGYSEAKFYRFDDIAARSNTGWSRTDAIVFQPAWKATKPGARIEFEVSGRNIGVVYSKLSDGTMGRAVVQVNDRPELVLEGHFTADWVGYPAAQLIAQDLPDGPHMLRISFAGDHHEESTGEAFVISGILAAK